MKISGRMIRLSVTGLTAGAAIVLLLLGSGPPREASTSRANLRALLGKPGGGTLPALPPAVEEALRGFGTAAGLDEAPLRAALLTWMAADPEAACHFVFHELPAGLTLKLLPDLMAALAGQSDGRILQCLSGIRTQTELTEAWRLVIEGRMAKDGSDALELARTAPPGAKIAESYLGRVLQGKDAAGIQDLLKRGLPTEWVLRGLRDMELNGRQLTDVSALALYRGFDAHFGGQWKKTDLINFLKALPPSADLAETYREVFKTDTGQRLRPGDLRDIVFFTARRKPEEAARFLSALPEGYMGAAVRSMVQRSVLNDPRRNPEERGEMLKAVGRPESDQIVAGAKISDFEQTMCLVSVGNRKDGAAALTKFAGEPEFLENPDFAKSAMGSMKGILGSGATLTTLLEASASLTPEQRAQLVPAAAPLVLERQADWESLRRNTPEPSRPFLEELIRTAQKSE